MGTDEVPYNRCVVWRMSESSLRTNLRLTESLAKNTLPEGKASTAYAVERLG